MLLDFTASSGATYLWIRLSDYKLHLGHCSNTLFSDLESMKMGNVKDDELKVYSSLSLINSLNLLIPNF